MAGFWKGKTVFVTGATGLMGGWLVKALLGEGAEIVALVRDAAHGNRSGGIGAGCFRGREGSDLALLLLRRTDHGASCDRVVSGRVA